MTDFPVCKIVLLQPTLVSGELKRALILFPSASHGPSRLFLPITALICTAIGG